MSKIKATLPVSFQYGDPAAQPDPRDIITLNANGQAYQLVKNGPSIEVPDLSLFSFIFGADYFPLDLFYTDSQFSAPQLTADNVLMARIPLEAGQQLEFTVYHQSDPSASGTAVIDFTVEPDQIGVLIVGTGGLTDPKA